MTSRKRQTGELPQPDLKVTCTVCQREILPSETIDYEERGIVCLTCKRAEVKEVNSLARKS
jgi:hypothetical protein